MLCITIHHNSDQIDAICYCERKSISGSRPLKYEKFGLNWRYHTVKSGPLRGMSDLMPVDLSLSKQTVMMKSSAANKTANDDPSVSSSFLLTRQLISRSLFGENQSLTREAMRDYLKDADSLDQVFVMKHATIVQKSYGLEKRFFCPPPCIQLRGSEWMRKLQDAKKNLLNEDADICCFMGLAHNDIKDYQKLVLDDLLYCSAKSLFVSDCERSRNIRLSARLFYSGSTNVGEFFSKEIKLISKPSRHRQSLRNSDFCFESGSQVSLFVRHRVHGNCTRFLHVRGRSFEASGLHWSSLQIFLQDRSQKESEMFDFQDGFIRYGSTVKIMCPITGLALPQLIIRQVEKQTVLLNSVEPVSQLHKCTFHLKNSSRMYLCLKGNIVSHMQASKVLGRESTRELVGEQAIWTIISSAQLEYRFFEGMGPVCMPISPIPTAHSIACNGAGDSCMLEIHGENLSFNLKVWIGERTCETFHRNERYIVAWLTKLSQPHDQQDDESASSTGLPICLVRGDGIIYPTRFSFVFTTKPSDCQPLACCGEETNIPIFCGIKMRRPEY